MEVPRGMEPTGTNGRTRHTFQPVWWVGSRPVVVFSLDGREHCFPVVTMTMSGEALVARVRCPVPGPPRSESVAWLVPFAGRFPGGLAVHIGFAVVMAQVRRPVPFRTRKLRPGRGDGTALERVWESSTPPHSSVGPSGRVPYGIPGRSFSYSPRGSRRAFRSGNPIFLFLSRFPGGFPDGDVPAGVLPGRPGGAFPLPGVPVGRNAPGTPFSCFAGLPAGPRCLGFTEGFSCSRSARSVSDFQREFLLFHKDFW